MTIFPLRDDPCFYFGALFKEFESLTFLGSNDGLRCEMALGRAYPDLFLQSLPRQSGEPPFNIHYSWPRNGEYDLLKAAYEQIGFKFGPMPSNDSQSMQMSYPGVKQMFCHAGTAEWLDASNILIGVYLDLDMITLREFLQFAHIMSDDEETARTQLEQFVLSRLPSVQLRSRKLPARVTRLPKFYGKVGPYCLVNEVEGYLDDFRLQIEEVEKSLRPVPQ